MVSSFFVLLTREFFCGNRFEAQLSAVKERLEQAKAGSTRGLGSPMGFSFAGAGSRIAKPLRGGGGGGPTDVPILPTVASLQQSEGSAGRRGSWWSSGR